MSQVNHLLRSLPREIQQRLLASCHRVSIPPRTTLCESGDRFEHAYFPVNGLVSLLSTTDDGETVEVAAIGCEGMLGLPILTGSTLAPYAVVVQLPTDALRISATALAAELTHAPLLHHILSHYVHAVVAQTSQTAVCYRFHTARQRVCRWLLVARDRSGTDTIAITQDTLAQTVGVSRTGITAIAVDLQDRGVLRCRHGRITVLDRRRLGSLSCECYRILYSGLSAPAGTASP